MFLSVFDIFKIGIGPSSSHTIGPMLAAGRFLQRLASGENRVPGSGAPARLGCRLHGSLAFTGKGHATDRAVTLGLAGFMPEDFDAEAGETALQRISETGRVEAAGLGSLAFDPRSDLVFDYGPALPLHPNGMVLSAFDAKDYLVDREIYYSIGGGFVVTEAEFSVGDTAPPPDIPFPFSTAEEMLGMAQGSGLSIAEMKRANEIAGGVRRDLDAGLDRIWQVMSRCIDRGLAAGGILPGGLSVKRRAGEIHAKLQAERGLNILPPHVTNDWLSVYAMAVNEENAAGGQVVTAPTNGAAGVVPAVIRYYLDQVPGAQPSRVRDFLLAAAAIGGIIKANASISGAEVGCQGEVGSAAAMAAAGFCTVLGGSPAQSENAAEIALEHHLGMTCDPVKGLVQIPCIERNGMGAIKAVAAASLALRGDGQHAVSLDVCIETLRQTGLDMDERYKETSRGGLAVNLPEC